MVNRGRPSRGCANCKARRIKCDETTPQCYKCTSTGRTCPGVPDDFDLVHRNKTEEVAARQRRASSQAPSRASSVRQSPKPGTSKARASPSVQSGSRSRASSVQRSRSTHSSTPQLSDETATQALNFFFQNHRPFITEGIDPIYQDAPSSSVLHQAVEALSLISFSNHFPTHCLRDRAVATYARALRSVNAAIQDPEESKADSTLLAIFLMCLYEMTEGSVTGMGSYANYRRHLDGAVAVLKHRGESQFQDQTSLQLFQAARMQMIHTYTVHSRAIPNFAPDKDWLCDTDDLEIFPNAVVKLSLDMAALRAKAKVVFAAGDVQPFAVSELLQGSMNVDSEASLRYNRLSTEWQPTMVPCYCREHSTCSVDEPCPSDHALEDANIWLGNPVIHVYNSMTVAHHVMNYYVVRMFANAMVMRCLRWFAEQGMEVDEADEFEHAHGRLQQVVDNICSCVPYHTESSFFVPSVAQASDEPASQVGYAPKHGAYFILTPLYFATLVESIPSIQRSWLRGQMRRLSRDYGLKHAELLCNARPCVISGELPWQPSAWTED